MMTSARILQFGEFAFDSGRQELHKGKFRIRISASQLRLLTLFLERPGQLISRDEIMRRLWKDTGTIDAERGINTAINSLRTTLGDNTTQPIYLETVIGLGYRFIVPVLEREPADPTLLLAVKPAVSDSEAKMAQFVVLHEVIEIDPVRVPAGAQHPLAGSQHVGPSGKDGHGWMSTRRRFVLVGLTLALLPLIGLGWIHVRAVRPVAQSKHSQVEFEPETFDYGNNQVSAAAVSPDGLKIAYADNFGISVHGSDDNPDRLLRTQPGLKVDHLSWLPDGVTLVVSGVDAAGGQHQVWLVEPSAYNLLYVQDASLAEPSPDGTLIAFTRSAGRELWIATIHGDKQRCLLAASTGEVIRFLLWSHDGRYLMLSKYRGFGMTDRATLPPPAAWSYQTVDAQTGQTLSKTADIEVDSGFLSQDGVLHYVNQAPVEGIVNKAHTIEMKIATEPGTGRLLGVPSIAEELPANQVRSLSASRDGTRKAYIFSRSALDIFVARIDESEMALKDKTPLTHGLWDAYPHAWMNDGSVLFERNLNGRTAIFSQQPGSEKPKIIAQMPFDLFRPQLSPDARWILFMSRQQQVNSLYRVPVGGGTLEEIPVQGDMEDYRCPLLAAASCVLSQAQGREAFVYRTFDPIRGVGKELARTPWRPARLGAWNLSPDGTRIAVADDSRTNPGLDIITISSDSNSIRFVPLPGRGTVLAPAWSTDGKTLYVECRTKAGFSLIYYKMPSDQDARGQEGVIETSPYLIYGIPSRDGKSLAFPLATTTTNVWVANR